MVLLKDIELIDNGAHFHSVDLHIHSYGASHDVSDATMTAEAIVDSAVRQGLSVIAITDHNSNVNVQRAIDHAHQNYAGHILVLPGVEVTTGESVLRPISTGRKQGSMHLPPVFKTGRRTLSSAQGCMVWSAIQQMPWSGIPITMSRAPQGWNARRFSTPDSWYKN
jgi:hypothetical protein